MDKFSKFLRNNEIAIVKSNRQKNNRILQLIIFLLLPFIFFLLYPLWQAGKEGFIFWIILLILWFLLLASSVFKQQGVYLLTDQRVLYFKLVNAEKYSLAGQISLAKIISVRKSGKNNLVLFTNYGKFHLTKLTNPEEIYQQIISLKRQNLV